MKKLQTIFPVLCFAIPGLLGLGWFKEHFHFASIEILWSVIDTTVSGIAIGTAIILLYKLKSK